EAELEGLLRSLNGEPMLLPFTVFEHCPDLLQRQLPGGAFIDGRNYIAVANAGLESGGASGDLVYLNFLHLLAGGDGEHPANVELVGFRERAIGLEDHLLARVVEDHPKPAKHLAAEDSREALLRRNSAAVARQANDGLVQRVRP